MIIPPPPQTLSSIVVNCIAKILVYSGDPCDNCPESRLGIKLSLWFQLTHLCNYFTRNRLLCNEYWRKSTSFVLLAKIGSLSLSRFVEKYVALFYCRIKCDLDDLWNELSSNPLSLPRHQIPKAKKVWIFSEYKKQSWDNLDQMTNSSVVPIIRSDRLSISLQSTINYAHKLVALENWK